MLTEKAIRDYTWCPQLFEEEAGREKREKPDRGGDTTLEFIHQALISGTSNKKVMTERTTLGVTGVPYEGDFWLVVRMDEITLLLTCAEVTLEKKDGTWWLNVKRKQRKEPTNPEARYAEAMVRRALASAMNEIFPNIKVRVETYYLGKVMPTVTENPEKEQLIEAYDFFEEIRASLAGERKLAIRPELCPHCWWKDCPKRVEVEEKPGQRAGKPSLDIL
jgi:hypothetical protein